MKIFRVRSRLVIPGFLGAVLLGIGVGLLVLTHTDPATAPEYWVKTSKFGLVRGIGWISLLLGLVMTAAYQVIEYRIYHGWEPKWLEKYVGIVQVLSVAPDVWAAQGFARIEVLNGRERDWYTLDPSEIGLCKAGDTIKLWSVGDQVSRLTVVQTFHGPELEGIAYLTHRGVGYFPGSYWLISSVLVPAFAGTKLSRVIELLIAQEDHIAAHLSKRKVFVPAHHNFGSQLYGEIALSLFFGIGIISYTFWALAKGTTKGSEELR